MVDAMTRLLLAICAVFLMGCETFNNNIYFPKFDPIGEDGRYKLYSYRSPTDRAYPHDSKSAEQLRMDMLEQQLKANGLSPTDYRIRERSLQHIRNAMSDGFPMYWVNYIVQVPRE